MKIITLWRVVSISVCVGMLLTLTGCWDRREINDVAFVLASAIDKEDDSFRVSVLIPLPGNMGSMGGGGGSGGQKPFAIKTETGKTVREAVSKLQFRLPRHLFFGHRRVIIIGEELARTEGVETVIDALTRTPENRLTAFIAITKGKAVDVLNADTRLERFSAESMRELLQSEASVRISVKDIISKIIAVGEDAFFPYVEKVQTKIKGSEAEDVLIEGFALTHDGKMTGVAKGSTAIGVRLLNQQFRKYDETFSDQGNYLTVSINEAKVSIKPIIQNDNITFRIHSKVKVSVNEDRNLNRNYDDYEQRKQIEQIVTKRVVEDIKLALDSMQRTNCDAVGFGLHVYRDYPHMWTKQYRKDWETIFPKVKFEVSATANLYRFGMTSENLGRKDQ
ncbi:Ger(x)C family spore germination protein [Paenibacillus sp. JDR-2]|uniref:Ger(x)C family spore germination protein n=1 Tax=Paenibacillus sp. (strain JDR-2) TaxID=324057 RepID=UPI00016648E0|nr:Ger(x)C family spore germination protein [Paenibacillus sp. JDR-2]ACT03922.1 germination protein, Ger(x)C family [Paenibacillus sp. JDR-2]